MQDDNVLIDLPSSLAKSKGELYLVLLFLPHLFLLSIVVDNCYISSKLLVTSQNFAPGIAEFSSICFG